jgi:hypothetical protein
MPPTHAPAAVPGYVHHAAPAAFLNPSYSPA